MMNMSALSARTVSETETESAAVTAATETTKIETVADAASTRIPMRKMFYMTGRGRGRGRG
jgi:hypothetical protein